MRSNELIFNETTQRFETRNNFNGPNLKGSRKAQVLLDGKWQPLNPTLRKRTPYARNWTTSYVKAVPLKHLKVRVKK
jgi:hypothetical protein